MPILNYTTSIEVDRTLDQIQRILIKHGVGRILTEYGPDRLPSGLSFAVEPLTAKGPSPCQPMSPAFTRS